MAYGKRENPLYSRRMLGLCALLVASAACDEDSGDEGDKIQRVELPFEARVGELLVDCKQTYAALGGASIQDLRFYVYDVRLLKSGGEEVPVTLDQSDFQYQDAALLDFENAADHCDVGTGTAALNSTLKGSVAKGSYTGVAFRVGLPRALNHSDILQTPSPLDIQHLSWGWTKGRVFLNLDLETASGPRFPVHIGSMMCAGNANAGEPVECARPNVADVSLTGFDPSSSKIVLDLDKLLRSVEIKAGTEGCMAQADNAACKAVFGALGLDPQTGVATTTQLAFFPATK